MSDTESIKQNLLSAPWRKYKDITVEGLSGEVTLVIRRPPDKEVLSLFESSQRDGLIDKAGNPTSPDAGLRFRARVVARCVFLPNATRPLLTEEETLQWPALGEVANDCMAALAPPGAAVEKLKGN